MTQMAPSPNTIILWEHNLGVYIYGEHRQQVLRTDHNGTKEI